MKKQEEKEEYFKLLNIENLISTRKKDTAQLVRSIANFFEGATNESVRISFKVELQK